MEKSIKFLTDLRDNNNREWFAAHKGEYNEALSEFNSFVEELIEGISTFDASVKGLTVKDCTYRIYRDTRFSNDKTPYKTHLGAYICRGGKKSGYAGYYFHLEPTGDGLLGCNIMSSGIYMPEPKVLKSIREDILDNGDRYLEAIKKAKGFRIDTEGGNSLKRNPAGFPPGSQYDDLLRLRNIYLEKRFGNEYALDGDLVKNLVRDFKSTYDFLRMVNMAVEYAYEEM